MTRLISLIVPVYNEEATIEIFYSTVRSKLAELDYDFEIVFINDGSRDKTEEIIEALARKDKLVTPLSFIRNFERKQLFSVGSNTAGETLRFPLMLTYKTQWRSSRNSFPNGKKALIRF